METKLDKLMRKQLGFIDRVSPKILSKVNIVDVVSRYVSIFQKGDLYFGTCPQHFDNLNSLSINEKAQTFECATCGIKGNALHFIAYFKHCSMFQACKELANLYHIDISEDLDKYDFKEKKLARYDLCVRSGNSMNRGVGSVEEVVNTAKELGLDGIALCDDYSTNGYQDFKAACSKAGIKAIYGATLNVEGDRVIVIAKNKQGINTINLLTSIAFDIDKYPYYENTYTQLFNNMHDIYAIPIANDVDELDNLLKKYLNVAISDSFEGFETIDEKYYSRIIAISDSYYCVNSDKLLHDSLVCKKTRDYKRIKSADELLRCFPRGFVFNNPCELVSSISDDNDFFPIKKPSIPYSEAGRGFIRRVLDKAKEMFGELSHEVNVRLLVECEGICDGGYTYIYDIYSKLVDYLKENNEPYSIRGSGSNSLVAYVLGISNINPLDWDLPGETFMGYDFNKIPDFDLNVSPLFKDKLAKYLQELLGEDNIARCGFVENYDAREALSMVTNLLKHFPQWDYRDYEKAQIFKLMSATSNYDVHSGGYLIKSSNDSFYDYSPVRRVTGDDIPACLNDFHQLHDLFYKVDLLGHKDLILEKYLLDHKDIVIPDGYYNDSDVLSLFSSDKALNKKEHLLSVNNGLLGISEFGTEFGGSVIEICAPKNLNDLIKVSGLMHGTNVWVDNAAKLLSRGVATLDDVIGCRDDIYNVLRHKYNVDHRVAINVMEDVRKGRGIRFEYERALVSHNVPQYLIDSLKKMRYLFPKGHAISYTLIALKQAYIKIHYSTLFYSFYLKHKSDRSIEFIRELLNRPIDKLLELSQSEPQDKTVKIIIEMYERGYKGNIDSEGNLTIEEG